MAEITEEPGWQEGASELAGGRAAEEDVLTGIAADEELRRRYILDHFEEALQEHQIEAWYQPVVRIQSRTVCGAEAFARWSSPQYGLMESLKFVSVLEHADLVHKLDLYMLDLVCREVHELLKRGDTQFLPISLNISKQTAKRIDLADVMEAACDRYGVPLGMVEVELHGTIAKPEQVVRLRADNIRVWADNLAGSHFSVTALANNPFDAMKLSKRIMAPGIEHNARFDVVIEGTIDIAKRLGVASAAKGVETEAQLEYLKRIGCEMAQGYLFARPAPIADLPAQLEASHTGYEKPDQRAYHEATGRINLLSSSYREAAGTAGAEHDAAPVAIVELTPTSAHVLAANEPYLDFARDEGYHSIEDIDYALSEGDQATRFREAATKAYETGCDQIYSYMKEEDRRQHRSQVHFIAADPTDGRWSVLLTSIDLGAFDESSLRTVSSMFASSAYVPSGPTAVLTKESLWDSLLTMGNLGFFWKDANRCFLGVSQYFLDYYGFDSDAAVIGKTDEEVGWHVNPGFFKSEEEHVLHEGRRVIDDHGTCIARGKINHIIANKVPIYQGDQIVGLLGCFRDAEKPLQVTGEGAAPYEGPFAEFGPLASLLVQFQQAYDRDDTDFVLCAVRLMGAEDAMQERGDDFADKVESAFQRLMEHLLHNSGIYARFGPMTMLVVKQFDRVGDADVFVDSMRSIPALLDGVDGVPLQLAVRIASVRYATCGIPDEMGRVMMQRMQEAGIVDPPSDEAQTSDEVQTSDEAQPSE